MTGLEMQIAFQREINQMADAPDFKSNDIFYWLNEAVSKFVKTRYAGINFKAESFEQTQKRIDDLRTLVDEERLTLADGTANVNKPYSRVGDLTGLSDDYWITLGEQVLLAFVGLTDSTSVVASGDLVIGSIYKVTVATLTHNAVIYNVGDYFVAVNANYTGNGSAVLGSSRREGVTECTIDNYTQLLDDPYSEHILHYDRAKPLRLFYQDTVELIGDGNYGIIYYYLRYLKEPVVVTLAVDCDLPNHTHTEIVKMAVNMSLENLKDPRYQSQTQEVSTME